MGILQKLNCFSCMPVEMGGGGGGGAADFGGQSELAIQVTIFPRDADSPGSITGPWYNILCQNSAGPCQCWVKLIALLESATL